MLLVMSALMLPYCSFAQSQKEVVKERKQTVKMAKSELNAKASKTARKEAKRLKREGWIVAPGALPLEKQLDRWYLMQFEVDDTGYPKYLSGDAMSIGENYDPAKNQALELAKQNLAGTIQTEVTNLIENTLANEQLTQEEAASIASSVSASKNLISQSLGRVITVVECYRVKDNKNKEVRVMIAYNSDMAKQDAKKAIRKDLEKKGQDLHEQLDRVLGF